MQLLRLSQGARFWEIDFLRGIAVILMIVFHFMFDLNFFVNYSFSLYSGTIFWIGRIAATLFLLLPGIALTLSFHNKKLEFKDFFLRGIKVFGLGLLITLITFVLFPQGTIWFGILHLIGVSIILGYFFMQRKKLSLAFGILLILLGLFLSQFSFSFPWLLWLGFFPSNFYTFDYFPLLPWFGVFLLGIFLGNQFYANGKRSFKIKEMNDNFSIRLLSFFGRNSLLIYLIHQPILIIVLKLFVLK
ncbi:MAG: heparan-alpha-glucosaminide N-acetyltransferase [archaeon]|nr:heparan-alpha-glucosaminide N-acetyltransferase [archaeon]